MDTLTVYDPDYWRSLAYKLSACLADALKLAPRHPEAPMQADTVGDVEFLAAHHLLRARAASAASRPYEVRPFGRDCLGNCSGWRVHDRATGDVLATFVGDIYDPEQRAAAHWSAYRLCWRLNGQQPVALNGPH